MARLMQNCHVYLASVVIVVSHERVERTQLGPAHTQLLRCAVQKSTDVSPNQWHSIEIEEQHCFKRTDNVD